MSRDGDLRSRDGYQPALDGVRGLAVAFVLLFHGGFAWMSGGYVGVSVFFTLSGFLITGLLLREREATGDIALRGFYIRRMRRLLPASVLCLAAVSVAAAFGAFDGVPHVRRDILAALFQVSNWNALAGGTSYADLIARTTGHLGPVDHFWSLSIEEQFYWLWPLVVAFLCRRVLGVVARRVWLVAMAAVSVAAAPVIAAIWGPNAAYWATPARLGEILVGAALAALGLGREWRGRWLPWAGLAGLLVIAVAAITWPPDRGPAYTGWLGVFALASAALIAGLQVPGPLRRLFSVRPLVHLGRISYGVYLYHWPVFALLDARRTGLDGWGLFLVQSVVTLAVAEASFTWIEQPIRRGARAPAAVVRRSLTAIGAVFVLTVAAVPAGASSAVGGDADVSATFAPDPTTTPSTNPPVRGTTTSQGAAPTDDTVESTTTSSVVPSGPLRVLVLGDSTAESLAGGLHEWSTLQQSAVQVASLAHPGCGFVRDSQMFADDGHFARECTQVLDVDLPATLAAHVPDLVVAMVTLPDVLERSWSDDEGPLRPTDDRYRARLRRDQEEMVARLFDAGVRRIEWVVGPPPSDDAVQNMIYTITDDDWAAYVQSVVDIAAAHPGRIGVVRLDRWMADHEPDDGSMRPDGVHLTPSAARQVADAVVGPAVLAAATAS